MNRLLKLFAVGCALSVSTHASAAIIGMFAESDGAQLSLVKIEKNYRILIAVTGQPIEKLFLSRYIGGEGGDVAKLLAALAKGQVPPPAEVLEWMKADQPGQRPTAKIGVFTDAHRFSYDSVLTGQRVDIPFVTAKRESVEHLNGGGVRTIFSFFFPYVLSKEDWQRIKNYEIDIALVSQTKNPGDWDYSLHRSVELSSRKLFQGDRIYVKDIRRRIRRGESCRELFKLF